MNPTLTVREVSALLKIKPKTLYRWIERDRIPSDAVVRLGRTIRLKREAVDQLMSEGLA
jgi:excisionase family DNA binding protein